MKRGIVFLEKKKRKSKKKTTKGCLKNRKAVEVFAKDFAEEIVQEE